MTKKASKNKIKEEKFIIHPASIRRVKESFECSKKKATNGSEIFVEIK